jgi:hypothetical protein
MPIPNIATIVKITNIFLLPIYIIVPPIIDPTPIPITDVDYNKD